jgi:hypothetical protein
VFSALAVSLLALAAPRLGAPLTLADLAPSSPYAYEQVIATWTENGAPVAIVERESFGVYQTVRLRFHADGTPDRSSATDLHVPPGATVARAGNGALAVWYDYPKNTLYASRTDATSVLELPSSKVLLQDLPYPLGTLHLTCGEVRCLMTSEGMNLLLDLDGKLRETLPGRFSLAVASRHEFLVQRCEGTPSACHTEILDENGAVRSSDARTVHRAIFDDTRFVAMSAQDQNRKISMWTIDPVTGVWSPPFFALAMPSASIDPIIAWNGSMYALSMVVTPDLPVNPCGCVLPWSGVMRLDRNLALLDLAPKKLADVLSYSQSPPPIAGAAGGFTVFLPFPSDSRASSVVLRNDGSIVPDPRHAATLFDGLGSQFVVAAASSPDAILGVWVERPGDGLRLRAARVTRNGTRIDLSPLEISSTADIFSVAAASDGAAFAVAWTELDPLTSTFRALVAIIDPSGSVHKTTIEPWPSFSNAAYNSVSLTFTAGAFQLALATEDGFEAVTLSANGTPVLHDSIPAHLHYNSRRALFDGHRLFGIWREDPGSLQWRVKDVPGFEAKGAGIGFNGVGNFTVAADGAGGYLVLLGAFEPQGGQPDRRLLMPISSSGQLVSASLPSLGAGFTGQPSLVRMGSSWLASWNDREGDSHIVAVDGTTLQPSPPLAWHAANVFPLMVRGRDNEALLIYNAVVPTPALPVAQATVTIIAPPERGRAASH